jgi:hypothetical protein
MAQQHHEGLKRREPKSETPTKESRNQGFREPFNVTFAGSHLKHTQECIGHTAMKKAV